MLELIWSRTWELGRREDFLPGHLPRPQMWARHVRIPSSGACHGLRGGAGIAATCRSSRDTCATRTSVSVVSLLTLPVMRRGCRSTGRETETRRGWWLKTIEQALEPGAQPSSRSHKAVLPVPGTM